MTIGQAGTEDEIYRLMMWVDKTFLDLFLTRDYGVIIFEV